MRFKKLLPISQYLLCTALSWILLISVGHASKISQFPSPRPQEEKIFFEAESMTIDGTTWKEGAEHLCTDVPSNLKFLDGWQGGQGKATKGAKITRSGVFRVWVRYADLIFPNLHGPFKVEVFQNGLLLGEKVFDQASLRQTPAEKAKWGSAYGQFVWDYLEVILFPGEAEIVLSKAEPLNVSSVTRKIDAFLVTNDLRYEPNVKDFAPKVYLKVRMADAQKEAAVIHLFGKTGRREGAGGIYIPHYNLTRNGDFQECFPRANDFLAAGQESPWLDLTPYLSQEGNNKMQLYATKDYSHALSKADYKIKLSTAPANHGIFKTFTRSGKGAYLYITLDPSKKDETKSDLEWSSEAWQNLQKLPVPPGKRAKRFPLTTNFGFNLEDVSPATTQNELDILTNLGFNGLLRRFEEIVRKHGFNRLSTVTSISQYRDDQCLVKPQKRNMQDALESLATFILANDGAQNLVNVCLADEPGSATLDDIVTKSCYQKAFIPYLQKKNLQPSDLGKTNWREVLPTKDKANEPRLYYQTALFRNQVVADFFKLGTEMLQKKLRTVKTCANYSEELTFTGNALQGGIDWFLIQSQEALTYGWTENWLNLGLTKQLCGYRDEFLKAATRLREQEYGVENITVGRLPWDIMSTAAADLGHGAKAINYFAYGPYYAPSNDEWSQQYACYGAVRQVNYAVGAVEDYLLHSKPLKSKIAFLYSPTTDIWTLDEEYSLFGKERMFLYILIRNLGYPIEVISEDEVMQGALHDYEFIVLEGSHVRKETVPIISDWVKNGGQLYLGAGSASFDQYNEKLNLDTLLNLKRDSLAYNYAKNNPGTDLYGLQRLLSMGTVRGNFGPLDILAGTQKTVAWPDNAEILATFPDQSPALISEKIGRGQVIFAGIFPGLAYAQSGIKSKVAADKVGERATLNPPTFPEGYRALFQKILEKIDYRPPVQVSHYLVEANVLESEQGMLILLANFSGERIAGLTLRVPKNGRIGEPSAVRNKLELLHDAGDYLTVKLNLDEFDFIKLPYNRP